MSETPKLLNRVVKLPVRAFIVSLEMFVQTAQELRKLFDQSIDAMMGAPDVSEMAGGSSYANQVMPGGVTLNTNEATSETDNSSVSPAVFMDNGTPCDGATTTLKETVNMRDANLNDDMLKLVRFKILFVKREYEMAFPEEEDLVPDNMTGADFSAWKVAEFIQRLAIRPPEVRFPKRWVTKSNYHRYGLPKSWEDAESLFAKALKANEEADRANKDAKIKPDDRKAYETDEIGKRAYEASKKAEPYWLIGFPEDDKKYLRVYYEVLERYPREKLRYEERQLEILEKIADGVYR